MTELFPERLADHLDINLFLLKGHRGMTSIWVFFLYEAVYPAVHDFFFF